MRISSAGTVPHGGKQLPPDGRDGYHLRLVCPPTSVSDEEVSEVKGNIYLIVTIAFPG